MATPFSQLPQPVKYEEGEAVFVSQYLPGKLFCGPKLDNILYNPEIMNLGPGREFKILRVIPSHESRTSISPNQPMSDDFKYRLTCDLPEIERTIYAEDRDVGLNNLKIAHKDLSISDASLIQFPGDDGLFENGTFAIVLKDYPYSLVIDRQPHKLCVKRGTLVKIIGRGLSRSGAVLQNLRPNNAFYEFVRIKVSTEKDVYWKSLSNVGYNAIAGRA